MLADPYFARLPPKSTGQEHFGWPWLEQFLREDRWAAQDVQSTLCELTACSVVAAIEQHAPDTAAIFLCGGGVHNDYLVERLRLRAGCPVATTEELGVHPDWVEAMAFAWLARRRLAGQPGNLPAVTGAARPVVLGAVYSA